MARGRARSVWMLILGMSSAAVSAPLTVGDARNLPVRELAKQLIGESLSAKVTDAVRHDYKDDPDLPEYVELYTQPELTNPRLNGICRTDVITIEYNWFELETGSMNDAPSAVSPSQRLTIAHVEARPRYEAFPMPPGEPGTDENDRAQAAACAGMKSALDSFRAPSAGDAQWLAAIEREYLNSNEPFHFTCSDYADRSCAKARRALQGLRLNSATEVQSVDCPKEKTGDQVAYCYRLTFPYTGEKRVSDRQDYHEFETASPEWELTVYAGMHDGMAPVRIRSLDLKHIAKRLVMH